MSEVPLYMVATLVSIRNQHNFLTLQPNTYDLHPKLYTLNP